MILEWILFIIVSILINYDTVISKYAIKKFGIKVEGNKWMRVLMKIDYSLAWATSLGLTAILYFSFNGGIFGWYIEWWGWLVNLIFWGWLAIQNIESVKKLKDYFKRKFSKS